MKRVALYAGGDEPDEFLFEGQPGVVIDLGPDGERSERRFN